jgi:uncharacterized protein YqcC (DUF446 family)
MATNANKTSAKQRQHGNKLARHLDAIEAELRRIGFWTDRPPKVEVESYLDAPTFELWLQQVFLPSARQAAAELDLPKESNVGLMALRQYDNHDHVGKAERLMALLSEFDELVEKFPR